MSVPNESFDVKNFTNTNLIIKFVYNFEYFDSFEDSPILTINNIDVIIRYFTIRNEFILAPGKGWSIIFYTPVSYINLNMIKLYEMSPCEKIKALFKSFTIQTMDGMFIISNIDDLRDEYIRKISSTSHPRYILEIYEDLIPSMYDGLGVEAIFAPDLIPKLTDNSH
jgi:hypothetical protein